MRKRLIVGNWKMNLNTQQASVLVHRLQERVRRRRDVEVVLCPSFLHLQPLSLQIDRTKFRLGAQNAYSVDEGAFTGEVSATMLHDLVHYVIVGHSERRHIFGEDDRLIAQKVAAVLRNDITPILCVGETGTERAANETGHVIHNQVTAGLRHLTTAEVRRTVIAYEPVWAISKGDYTNHKAATPDDVATAVKAIRKHIGHLYGPKTASAIRVLYGGSTNAENTKAFLSVEGVDGLLVGGASINYDQFSRMVAFAHREDEEEGGNG